MEQLMARTIVEDKMLLRGMSKGDMDRYIKMNLSRSLSEELIKQNLDYITVKRPISYGIDPFNPIGTEYEMRVFVLTQDEYKEFQDLKEFQKRMKEFVK